MGAFSDLLTECTALTDGQVVEFRYKAAPPGCDDRTWGAWTLDLVGVGRSGEEALRNLVEALRARAA